MKGTQEAIESMQEVYYRNLKAYTKKSEGTRNSPAPIQTPNKT